MILLTKGINIYINAFNKIAIFKLCLPYTVSRSVDSRKKQRCINLYHAALLTVNIRRGTLPLKA